MAGRSANRDCLLGIFGRLTATCRLADGTASLFASGGDLGLQDGRRALAADPVHETVTAVAYRWGFRSSSRFAAAYRHAYGVLPSQTLNHD